MQNPLPTIPSGRVIGDSANRYLRWSRDECIGFADHPTVLAWFNIVVDFIHRHYAQWDRGRKKDFAHATGEILDEVREVHHGGAVAVADVLARSLWPSDFRIR
ncbi:hypothetical protein BMF94_4001 [Rhodotorula taiwanensis]|uniref:Uncharacterized protein n=1 Tax=Rhodotorula taiwanensis TaxID=741276 RepID=A0A2S5B8D3_9BASI|nr:hypothetical protein BMF94_4001 [Rhodotorula taiwanensis]